MSPLLAVFVMMGRWAQAHPVLLGSLSGALLSILCINAVRLGLRTHRRY